MDEFIEPNSEEASQIKKLDLISEAKKNNLERNCILKTKKLEVVLISLGKGDEIKTHECDNMDQYYHVVSGTVLFIIDHHRIFVLNETDGIIIRKDHWYEAIAKNDSKLYLIKN
jgi:mannose-6-phosphate isomerase-like protein (cupin superfamily)